MDKLKKIQFDILPKWWSIVIWLLLFFLIFLIGCAGTSNGAINYNTTSYYINGKFTDTIPDSLIRKQYGYKMADDLNGKEHTYSQPVIMKQNSTITMYCTIHRGWENIRSTWLVSKEGYGFIISNHKKF